MNTSSGDGGEHKKSKRCSCPSSIWNAIDRRRNVLAFWIFGMSTNFIFIISLSAAHDILDTDDDDTNEETNHGVNTTDSDSDILYCNTQGTGVVLLSSILPELILKIVIQFSPRDISYCIKVGVTVISGVASFILFAFGKEIWIRLIGVVCSGIAFGLGETTFVPLTSFYDKNAISAWSSGTGAAGLIGTLVYAGFTSLGVSTRTMMLAMLVVPITMAVTYVCMLKPDVMETDDPLDMENNILVKKDDSSSNGSTISLREKLRLLPSLFKYLFSLGLAYLTVYFINQGLSELLYFNNQFLSRSEQYRWFQVDYRLGVFFARLGFQILIMKNLWVSPLILCAIVAVLTCQVFYRFIPSLWIVMVIIFMEGFMNGIAYVSTFVYATTKVESVEKEFTLGVITLSGPIGIFLAGVAATPFHNYVCSLDIKI